MSETSDRSFSPRRPRMLAVLVVLLAIESAGLVAATVFLVFELLVAPADSFASAIALTICVAIAAVWVAAIAVGAWRGQAWIRGASIVVQVLLAAIAIGSFQGILPRPDIGWILLLPAIAVVALLFSRPVQGYLRRDERQQN
jgi:hypothetical protein